MLSLVSMFHIFLQLTIAWFLFLHPRFLSHDYSYKCGTPTEMQIIKVSNEKMSVFVECIIWFINHRIGTKQKISSSCSTENQIKYLCIFLEVLLKCAVCSFVRSSLCDLCASITRKWLLHLEGWHSPLPMWRIFFFFALLSGIQR